jgi:Immunity protein 53
MDNLTWLQQWYASHCDGEWEHGHGVHIDTLDNPGWAIKIALRGTPYVELIFDEIERKGEEDWIVCRKRDGFFEGCGGAKNLDEILGVFRAWVDSRLEPADTDRREPDL